MSAAGIYLFYINILFKKISAAKAGIEQGYCVVIEIACVVF